MANIESKNLLVAVKAFARGNALPLDKDEVWESLSEAQAYAASPTAYAGQTIKALIDGKYKTYILQPTELEGYELEEIGSSTQVDTKQYVKIVTTLPQSEQEQGVIYINTTDNKGYIWTGTAYKTIFEDIEGGLSEKISEIETALTEKAPINNPVFTGTVTLAADPTENLQAVTKQYVDRLIDGLVNSAPGIVDSINELPTTDYRAGESWRVAESGVYAGHNCETGDLIICVNDYNAASAGNSDFIVVQANIDGAVTGPATSIDANIAIFDGITGKKIKDSTITLATLQDVIAKAHEHSNKTVLDSYTSTQSELLENVDAKVAEAKTELQSAIDLKANKTEIDATIQTITNNLNTKVDSDAVNTAITNATPNIVQQAKDYTDNRIGEIPEDTTLKSYVDNAIGSGGTSFAEAIAQAKQEAINTSKTYADSLLELQTF